MKTRVPLILAAALALTACQGRRFEPAKTVSKFRLLGVQSSPPELRPAQAATFEALAVRADGGPISYRWDWCPFATTGGNYFECPVTQEELEAQITAGLPDGVPANLFQLPDFDLGTDPTASLPYPIAQPLLVAMCEAIAQAAADAGEESGFAAAIPQLSCSEGYEITIRLVATASDEPASDEMLANLVEQDQAEVIVASKKITLWLDSENEQDINPIVDQIDIRPKHEQDVDKLLDAGHDWVDGLDVEEDWYTIDPEDPPPILVGVNYELRSLVNPDSVQTYSKLAPSGGEGDERYQPAKREVLVYNWFTTAGTLSNGESLFVEIGADGRGNTLSDAGVTELFIPLTNTLQDGGSDGQRFIDSCPELDDGDTANGCEVNLWSVVRDDRRGQGWLQVSLLATGIEENGYDGEDEDVDVDVN